MFQSKRKSEKKKLFLRKSKIQYKKGVNNNKLAHTNRLKNLDYISIRFHT